jgi:hypothetical protein
MWAGKHPVAEQTSVAGFFLWAMPMRRQKKFWL